MPKVTEVLLMNPWNTEEIRLTLRLPESLKRHWPKALAFAPILFLRERDRAHLLLHLEGGGRICLSVFRFTDAERKCHWYIDTSSRSSITASQPLPAESAEILVNSEEIQDICAGFADAFGFPEATRNGSICIYGKNGYPQRGHDKPWNLLLYWKNGELFVEHWRETTTDIPKD